MRLPPIFHYWSNATSLRARAVRNHAHLGRVAPHRRESQTSADRSAATIRHVARATVTAEVADWRPHLKSMKIRRVHDRVLSDRRSKLAGRCIDARRPRVGSTVVAQSTESRGRPRSGDAVLATQSLASRSSALRASIRDELRTLVEPTSMCIVVGHRWSTMDTGAGPRPANIVDELWNELPSPLSTSTVSCRRQEEPRSATRTARSRDSRAFGPRTILSEAASVRFRFDLFIGFANIDRSVHRSVLWLQLRRDADSDRSFIDRVHARDESELAVGRGSEPAHMLR